MQGVVSRAENEVRDARCLPNAKDYQNAQICPASLRICGAVRLDSGLVQAAACFGGSFHLSCRFEAEVLSHRPDIVTIDYALNDRGLGLERARAAWAAMIRVAVYRRIHRSISDSAFLHAGESNLDAAAVPGYNETERAGLWAVLQDTLESDAAA